MNTVLFAVLYLVVPDAGPETGRDAFRDLWQRMTGEEAAVVRESAFKGGGRAVWFGDTARAKEAGALNEQLRREEIVVRTLDNGDVLVNGRNDYGRLAAMYEFLERLGCRWYDAWNRVIPKRGADEPFPRLDIRRTPSFLYRHLFTAEDDRNTCQWDNFPYKNDYAWRESYTHRAEPFFGSPGAIHSFWDYMKDWGTNHVDWLSIDEKGEPRKLLGRVGPCFCFSHPGPREDFRAKLLGFIAADRELAAKNRTDPPLVYVLAQNDATKYFCKCPKCAKISEERGESALLIDFINDLADTVKAKYPDIYLMMEAYANAEPPPKDGTKPRDNVMVEYARTKGTYYLPVEEDLLEETGGRQSYEELMRWKELAKAMCIWDYWVFYWDAFPAAYHNVHFIGRNIRFYYHKLGARVARFECEAAETASFHALKKYLAYKLMDDVTRDENEVIDDFLKGYYGPAAPEMKELLDYIAKRQEGSRMTVFQRGVYAAGGKKWGASREWLDVEFYRRTSDIFERALAKLPEKCMYRVNVNRERIPCDLSIIHRYSELKPPVALDELVDRYVVCAKQQAKLHHRKNRDAFLSRIDQQASTLRHAEEIAATRKNPPRRELEVANYPEWTEMTDWYNNVGFRETERRLSLKLTRRSGNVLVVRMREDGIDYPVVTDRTNGTGDDYELFLGGPSGPFFQILVAPNGRYDLYYAGRIVKIDSVKVSADYADGHFAAEFEIPIDDLPVKNLRYGNFMRCSPGFECAWSPTLCRVRGAQGRFGELKFR